jgi:hypothetical protein
MECRDGHRLVYVVARQQRAVGLTGELAWRHLPESSVGTTNILFSLPGFDQPLFS